MLKRSSVRFEATQYNACMLSSSYLDIRRGNIIALWGYRGKTKQNIYTMSSLVSLCARKLVRNMCSMTLSFDIIRKGDHQPTWLGMSPMLKATIL